VDRWGVSNYDSIDHLRDAICRYSLIVTAANWPHSIERTGVPHASFDNWQKVSVHIRRYTGFAHGINCRPKVGVFGGVISCHISFLKLSISVAFG